MTNLKLYLPRFLNGIRFILVSVFKDSGLFAGCIAIFVFPFVFIWGLLSVVLFPVLVFILASLMFFYLVLNALAPQIVNNVLNIISLAGNRLRGIVSFEKHFSLKKDNKKWIRSIKLDKKTHLPVKKGRVSSEFNRFATIVTWLFQCKDLLPAFITFLARVEIMIQKNGSTFTFKYLKECFRIITQNLAGTPHLRGDITKDGSWIFIRLDHFGLPKILPLELRKDMRNFIKHYDSVERIGEGFTLAGAPQSFTVDKYHPNKWNNTTQLPFLTKRIVAVLSIATIFRVLSTNVEASLKTVVSPFTGETFTLPKDVISQALTELTAERKRGKSRFDFNTGEMIFEKDIKRTKPVSLSTGEFSPHFSPKAGPNGSLSTYSAHLDALAFMHEPLKGLKLIGWMLDQKGSELYVLWFIALNVVFGIPYLVWFHILTGWDKFLTLVASYPVIYYWFKDGWIGRFFSFWTLTLHNSKGLVHSKLYLGKLGVVYDQAGKARVVASTNWWIQSAFKGLHDNIFDLLKQIPQDGTFDQDATFTRFLTKVNKSEKMSGFDLSAATDRLPIQLQRDILISCGVDGQTWVDLLDFSWHVPFENVENLTSCRYAVGQPMGAYSSWAMLALTHHVIVFAAYKQAGIDFDTANYAVLGDDMVVNHNLVGQTYVTIMASLGLEISKGKSVISNRFTEFAKKLRGPDINLTPVGAGAVLAACRSGYMFPALIKASIGTAVSSSQELLDLVDKVPSGLVARRDLKMFTNLVLWQFFGPSGRGQVIPAHFGSMLLEWVSGLPKTASTLVTHIFDSISFVNMRRRREALKNSHLPMVTLLTALATVTLTRVPFLRVLETLMTFVNPGFWIYFKKALLVDITFWEDMQKLYANLPHVYEDGYIGDLQKLQYLVQHIKELGLIGEFPLTKEETKLAATFFRDIQKDMLKRHNLSERHILHRDWYELTSHYGRTDWPDFSQPLP